jgi:hypothetical protein
MPADKTAWPHPRRARCAPPTRQPAAPAATRVSTFGCHRFRPAGEAHTAFRHSPCAAMILARFSRSASAWRAIARCMLSGSWISLSSKTVTLTLHSSVWTSRISRMDQPRPARLARDLPELDHHGALVLLDDIESDHRPAFSDALVVMAGGGPTRRRGLAMDWAPDVTGVAMTDRSRGQRLIAGAGRALPPKSWSERGAEARRSELPSARGARCWGSQVGCLAEPGSVVALRHADG